MNVLPGKISAVSKVFAWIFAIAIVFLVAKRSHIIAAQTGAEDAISSVKRSGDIQDGGSEREPSNLADDLATLPDSSLLKILSGLGRSNKAESNPKESSLLIELLSTMRKNSEGKEKDASSMKWNSNSLPVDSDSRESNNNNRSVTGVGNSVRKDNDENSDDANDAADDGDHDDEAEHGVFLRANVKSKHDESEDEDFVDTDEKDEDDDDDEQRVLSKTSGSISATENDRGQKDLDRNDPDKWVGQSDVLTEDYLSTSLALEWYYTVHRDETTAPKTRPLSDPLADQDVSIPLRCALVFVDRYLNNNDKKKLFYFFDHQRIDFHVTKYQFQIPPLLLAGTKRPLYSIIIFDDYAAYLNMPAEKKEMIDSYCSKYSVNILGFTRRGETITFSEDAQLTLVNNVEVKGYKLDEASPLWRVAKKEVVYDGDLPGNDWTVFVTNHETYSPLVYSTVVGGAKSDDITREEYGSVIGFLDNGLLDNIKRVVLGNTADYWLNRIVAVDALAYLTYGMFRLPLERYMQVDIDDMFLGDSPNKTRPWDAEALLACQKYVRSHYMPNFRFVLGFCGARFDGGDSEEVRGAEMLLEDRDQYYWYNHFYGHKQAHLLDRDGIWQELHRNEEFAKEHNLEYLHTYTVVPHHSGMFPAHEPLYDLLSETGTIASATETYPNRKPELRRRGYVYRGIRVLPRASFNLWTSTNHFSDYRGGKPALDDYIKGGGLFMKFLHRQVLPIMTHMNNYANGQLGQYALNQSLAFVTTWTNLKLLAPPPPSIADIYFRLYPRELSPPLWENPCDDEWFQSIWDPSKDCTRLPDFLLVGPSTTGVDTLASYLNLHPDIVRGRGGEDGEDLDFFTSHYDKGLDWYMDHFRTKEELSRDYDNGRQSQFEKSVTYFLSDVAAKRIHSLVPRVKLIMTFVNPVQRAFKHFTSRQTRGDEAARATGAFQRVLKARDASLAVAELREGCLEGGRYARHLAKFLYHFDRSQILIVDGDALQARPAQVMNTVQNFLKLPHKIDYNGRLEPPSERSHQCPSQGPCVFDPYFSAPDIRGSSKEWEEEEEAKLFLQQHYKEHDRDLASLLVDLAMPLPGWLWGLVNENGE